MTPVVDALEAAGAEVLTYDSCQSPDLTGSVPNGVIWNDGPLRGIAGTLPAFRDWLRAKQPQAVLVQGDTATAFACALTAWLEGIPVGHVEAGLRTYASEPFPEEGFRRMIAPMARWHFCPDEDSADNVRKEIGLNMVKLNWVEALPRSVFVTGNPLIDTLPPKPLRILVTLHRRENWGARIGNALLTIDQFCREHDACATVIRHPNWKKAVGIDAEKLLAPHFLDPVSHERLLEMLESCDLVVTDSGGLQEEAAHYGVPCLVLRTATERKALERLGAVTVVNPDEPEALAAALRAMAAKRTAYGAGDAGERIAKVLIDDLEKNERHESVA